MVCDREGIGKGLARLLALCAVALLGGSPAAGQAVLFSHAGGFYADTFSLGMEVRYAPADSHYAIHYTLNGAEPTECDTRYTGPLPLTERCYSQAALYKVQTVPDDRWFAPDEVEHIIVVRAAAFDSEGYRRSAVTTQAYLIDSLMHRRISLPVVSLCADSLSLFDYDTGLFVMGYYHDPHLPYSTGNYFQKGRMWERAAAMGYYVPDGGTLEQDCGLRVHGNSQRVLAQKGLSLYARSDYGEKSFRYPFFGHRKQNSYRRLVLRPWKTSWGASGVEDWLCQQIAEPLRCDNMANRPVVLFINGEYWGIYFLEEKADEHYVEEHHGVADEEVDLLAYWGEEVENGHVARWDSLYQWLQDADLSREADYNYLASQVDIDALIDYMLLQILVQNDDWPVNNVRYWSAPERKWRWLFFDGDGALCAMPKRSAILDYVTYNVPRRSTHTSLRATLLFRRLYGNAGFLQRTMERLRELEETHFAYRNTSPHLQRIAQELEPEVPYQIRRFDSPSSMAGWWAAVQVIDDFLRMEPAAMVEEYAQYFGLKEDPDRECEVTVYDPMGREVLRRRARPSELPFEGLPAGRYYVKMGNGETQKWRIGS